MVLTHIRSNDRIAKQVLQWGTTEEGDSQRTLGERAGKRKGLQVQLEENGGKWRQPCKI